jgi:hypothetical protein
MGEIFMAFRKEGEIEVVKIKINLLSEEIV